MNLYGQTLTVLGDKTFTYVLMLLSSWKQQLCGHVSSQYQEVIYHSHCDNIGRDVSDITDWRISNPSPFMVRIGSMDKENINTIHMTPQSSPKQGCLTTIVININSQAPLCTGTCTRTTTLTRKQQQSIQYGLGIMPSSIMDDCLSTLSQQAHHKSVSIPSHQ